MDVFSTLMPSEKEAGTGSERRIDPPGVQKKSRGCPGAWGRRNCHYGGGRERRGLLSDAVAVEV